MSLMSRDEYQRATVQERIEDCITGLQDTTWVSPLPRRLALRRLMRVSCYPQARAAVPAVRNALVDPDWFTRQSAAELLGLLDACTEEAVSTLIEGLTSNESAQLAGAAQALGHLGPTARTAIPTLCTLLDNPLVVGEVRRAAVQALRSIRPSLESAAPALMRGMELPEDPIFIEAAAKTLGSMGRPAVPLLIALLDYGCFTVQKVAWRELTKIRWIPVGAIPAFFGARFFDYTEFRRVIGWFAEDPVPALMEAIQHPRAKVRRYALCALGKLKAIQESHLPILVGALSDDDEHVSDQASWTLRAFIRTVPGVVSRLAELLVPQTPLPIRRRIIEVFGACPGKAIPLLIEALQDPDEWIRYGAARALGTAGEEALPAVPALVAALHDESRRTRSEIASALSRVAPWEAAPIAVLRESLRDEDDDDLRQTFETLARMATTSEPATETLQELLAEPDLGLRKQFLVGMVEGFREVGAVPEKLAPSFLEALNDDDAGVRCRAAEALGMIGPAAADALPALLELLKDEHEEVRFRTLIALGQLGPVACVAVSKILDLVANEPSANVCRAAALALWVLGRRADVAVPLLLRTTELYGCHVHELMDGYPLDQLYEEWPGRVKFICDLVNTDRSVLARVHAAIEAGQSAAERLTACRVSWWLEQRADLIVDALADALGQRNIEVVAAAAELLFEIGPQAKDRAATAAVGLLRRSDCWVKPWYAAQVLGSIGTGFPDQESLQTAVTALIRALDYGEQVEDYTYGLGFHIREVRTVAAQALGQIQPQIQNTIPTLVETLENDYIRRTLVEWLTEDPEALAPHLQMMARRMMAFP